MLGIGLRLTRFLAKEAMVREFIEDNLANFFLTFHIGLGDRTLVGLPRYREVSLVIRTADYSRRLGRM